VQFRTVQEDKDMPRQDTSEGGGSERYYYADGRKVPLVRSTKFVAVRAEGETERAAVMARAQSAFAGVAGPGRVYDLPQYGLAVIAVNGGAGGPASGDVVRALSAQPGAQPGPEVYQIPGAEEGHALVAVDEVLVKFRPDVPEDARKRLLERNKLEVKQRDYPEPDAYVVTLKGDGDPVAVANALHDNDAVETAEPHFAVLTPRLQGLEPFGNGGHVPVPPAGPGLHEAPGPRPLAAGGEIELPGPAVPATDPNFSSQWGLQKIRAPEAWDISMGSPSISVAIIDEGNDLTHEDIDYKLPGYDAYDGDDDPTPQPQDGHGTSCGGISAARANNGKGGAGVAPRCKILPVRIARGIGGGYWDTSSAKVADGIRKAVDRGADALSNSYGVTPSTFVTNAFNYARTNGRGGKGCPIAAATGNGDVLGVIYPANLSPTIPGFMAVGASNQWDQRKSKTSLDGESWWGSNFGPEVDVVAPGVQIFTTDIMGSGGYSSGNYVPNFNGTSSATPHVAGLMALILSVDPDLRSWEVEEIIKLTALDLGTAGRDQQFGFGRIDCRRALEAASRIWYQVNVWPVFIGSGRECFMRLNVRMYNPGINSVRLDALTITSHSADWSAEIDRLEYRPNPGGVMRPRSSDDVRLNNVLLRANGNQSSWSYRWNLAWSYTYWRPGAPSLPLDASQPASDVQERTARGLGARGSSEGNAVKTTQSGPGTRADAPGNGADRATGDTVTVDRESRAITIVIR
jgi:thermitase